MRRFAIPRTLLLTLLLLGLHQPVFAGPPEPPAPSDNAAVWYLTAQYVFLDLMDHHQDLLDSWENPDLKQTAQAITSAEAGLAYIRSGASMDHCAWAADFKSDGPHTPLPHLGLFRDYAKLLSISAQLRFANGDTEGGMSELLVIHRMARHAAADGSLIGCLVQLSIDGVAIKTLARHLDQFDRAGLLALRQQINQLPALLTVGDSIEVERSLLWWLKDIIDRDGLEKGFAKLQDIDVDAQLADANKPQPAPEQIAAWFNEADAYYLQSAKLMALPYLQFEEAYAPLERQPTSVANPFRQLLPAFGTARQSQLRIEILQAMIQAMIAYRLDGEQGFQSVLDPYDGKPFSRAQTEEGMQVRSRFMVNDKAWSLTFPAAMVEPLD